jgi:molybdate transport system regulatory protein
MNLKISLIIMKKDGQHGGGAEVTTNAIRPCRNMINCSKKINKLLEQHEALLKVVLKGLFSES